MAKKLNKKKQAVKDPVQHKAKQMQFFNASDSEQLKNRLFKAIEKADRVTFRNLIDHTKTKDLLDISKPSLMEQIVTYGLTHHLSYYINKIKDDVDHLYGPDRFEQMINTLESSMTLAHMAINRPRQDMLQMLIDNGADTELRDYQGVALLHLAVRMMHPPCVQTLLNAHCRIRSLATNPITMAEFYTRANSGKNIKEAREIMNSLIDAGCPLPEEYLTFQYLPVVLKSRKNRGENPPF